MTEQLHCVITCCEIPALLEAACSCLWPIYETDGCKVKRGFCVAAFLCSLRKAQMIFWYGHCHCASFCLLTTKIDKYIHRNSLYSWLFLQCCIHTGGCGPDLVRAALKEHKRAAVQKQGCRNPLPALSLIYSDSGWMQMREHLFLLAWLCAGKPPPSLFNAQSQK